MMLALRAWYLRKAPQMFCISHWNGIWEVIYLVTAHLLATVQCRRVSLCVGKGEWKVRDCMETSMMHLLGSNINNIPMEIFLGFEVVTRATAERSPFLSKISSALSTNMIWNCRLYFIPFSSQFSETSRRFGYVSGWIEPLSFFDVHAMSSFIQHLTRKNRKLMTITFSQRLSNPDLGGTTGWILMFKVSALWYSSRETRSLLQSFVWYLIYIISVFSSPRL